MTKCGLLHLQKQKATGMLGCQWRVFGAAQTCACVGLLASHMYQCLQAHEHVFQERTSVFVCVFEYILVLVNFHPCLFLGWLKFQIPELWIKADSGGEYRALSVSL